MLRKNDFRSGWIGFIQAGLLVPLLLTGWAATSHGTMEAPTSQTAVLVSVDFYVDWGSGACGEGVVKNQGSTRSIWEVEVDLTGSVTSHWDMRYSKHPHQGGNDISHSRHIVGAPWNRTLEPGASTSFGFCIDRTQEPEMPPAEVPTMPMEEPHMHPVEDGEFIDLATFGLSHGSDHTGHDGLVGGRTAITTEALLAYNDLRAFVGLAPATLDEVGEWAFANTLTNNTQAWGNDQEGVGLWYAMQGAKVGWMADDRFDPQVVADISRTARLGAAEDVMDMVAEYGHEGFADYLAENGYAEAFINTLKMEPHYAGWMHDRAHGWLSIEDVAIAHDVNHLTVLSHDQMQPFMNDTWDWPQWPALDVSHARVLEYFQSMVALGDPLGNNLANLAAPPIQDDPVENPSENEPVENPVQEDPAPEDPIDEEPVQEEPIEDTTPPAEPADPVTPPVEDHEGHDEGSHDHMAPPASSGDYTDITSWGTFHGSNNNSEHNELVGGRTAITTEAHEAYNNLRAFLGLPAATIEEVGEWAFSESLTNNSQAWGNDIQGVGLWYAMQGAKVGWITDEAYDPQILADIQRTARLVADPDEMKATVMEMVREYGHAGYADYLEQYGIVDTFINTIKMEPHYGGWMHGRTHGFRSIEGVAINHDINHLTVLSWDQMQPFMNDTFDWPQWDALDVSDSGVIEYYQSMVSLGNPVGQNLEFAPTPITPPTPETPEEPAAPPMEDHEGHEGHDHGEETPAPENPVDEEPVQEDPVEEDPVETPAEDPEGHDHGGSTPAGDGSLELVAATTSVSVLVDPDTGLAYVQEQGGQPILITRDDDYWVGDVPLTRGDATIMAAARDGQGRLRVLDGGGLDVYAWVLNADGFFIGQDGPGDTSTADKEALFQFDIDGDGMLGQEEDTTPPAEPADPVTPPVEDHEGHDEGSHDHMAPPASSGDYTDITSWGTFHGSNNNSEHNELVGGRTAITTEAHEAYNNLRAFLGLPAATIEEVGEWAFSESLTNNSQAWGNDIQGVGLWYAMQGAKVGWITDEAYDPQILADIQRTARLVADPDEMKATVMEMVREYGHAGYADYLEQYGIVDTFINTIKMEPHYGGWMHGRTHGFRSIEGVAINHDINHLTVLSWDQMQPFMNDTFDWPQWDALDVSDSGVIEYYQSMVSLGNPVGQNLEFAPTPITPTTPETPEEPAAPPMEDHEGHEGHDHGEETPTPEDPIDEEPVQEDPVEEDPVETPAEDPEGHDEGSHDHMAPPASSGDYTDITSWGTFHGSNNNSEHNELVGGRTAITTEAHEAYNNLRAFLGLPAATIEEVGEWAFSESLTNNSQAWGNDIQGVGLWYAMQGAKVGWITDEAYDPQILADIQRTARLVADPDEMKATVMEMVREYGHAGYADYLEQYGIVDTFINTIKMEPHYGGWMHGRTHGFRSIEGVAINHDINHLTVLSWDQMQPFMNDTFDWPQWDALDVSDSGVIEYYQSMVSLGNPVGQNL